MTGVNPLNPLLGKIERFEQAGERADQWESSRVEWTLRRLKLEDQRKEILSDAVGGRYTFSDFHRVVNFPIRLVAEPLLNEPPIHRDQRSIHPAWFRSFRGLPFVRKYEEHFEELGDLYKGTPIGMVFPRKGFQQGMILHNGDWELFVPPQSSCHLFKGGKTHKMNLIVQPYIGFIDHLKKGLVWSP